MTADYKQSRINAIEGTQLTFLCVAQCFARDHSDFVPQFIELSSDLPLILDMYCYF